MNLTVVQPTGNGFITAYPADNPVPGTSNVNYLTRQTVANLSQVQATYGLGRRHLRDVTITNSEVSGTVEVIADVFGYYTPN